MTKRNNLELITGVVTLVLVAAAAILFGMSYTTNYYIFGQMQSGTVALLLGAAAVATVAGMVCRAKFPQAFWPKLFVFAVAGCLAGAAALLLGDRVEGIGNCIVTDYDSGHGGEEAIYMSIASCLLMLFGVVYTSIGAFAGDKEPGKEPAAAKKSTLTQIVAFGVSAVAVLALVIIPTANMVRGNAPGAAVGSISDGKYAVTYNVNSGNVEGMPGYQFLGGDLSGMMMAEARLFVDVTLELDGNGSYNLKSDAYVYDSGARCEIGDDSGLGLVLITEAEGTYVTNPDGTVTTSVPTHSTYTLETDTYSSQLSGALGLGEDRTQDSNDAPEILDFVPETTWTLGAGSIVSWRDAASGGTFTVSLNANNDNLDVAADYQFLGGNLVAIMPMEARLFVDVTLTLDGNGHYNLFSDAYVIDNGARCYVGDDSGMGMTLTMTAEGTYTENADGTYTTNTPTHAVYEMDFDDYPAQLRDALGINVDGSVEAGSYDSAAHGSILDFVPETVWTLDSGTILNWTAAGAGEEEEPAGDGLTITSDDGATTFTFYADWTYVFAFDAYGIEDPGTYSFDGQTLTIINANGDEVTAEGDPLKFHYVSAINEQLAGDFTVGAAELGGYLSSHLEQGGSENGLTFPSDDGATTLTIYADGTYVFAFAQYGIEDPGTYTYDGTTLTLINANGDEFSGSGNPIKIHYVSAVNEQLAGDFTIDLSALMGGGGEEPPAAGGLTFPSDDGATTLTINADGTYVFAFAQYGIEDPGTYTYDGTTLTLINANGSEFSGSGNPIKIHYVSAVNEQLAGDFTIDLSALMGGGEAAAPAGDGVTVASDDGGTQITFNADGTYVFAFTAYGVEDPGTYTWDGTTLTVTNANGVEVTATGDPLTFHYVSAVSDQLTGDFTVPAADLP